MSPIEFLLLLVIAGIAGTIGQSLAGFSRGGFLRSIFLGFIGALFGSWIARSLSLPEPFMVTFGDSRFPVLWSIIGSALFIAALGLLAGNARKRRS